MLRTSKNTSQKTSFDQYLGRIKGAVPGHANFATAARVFECLAYIEENIEEIAGMAGKVSLLRHPGNNLAFHLNGMNSPEQANTNFSALLSEVRGCVEHIFAIEDVELQAFVLSSFVSNINDSAVGCMEARLRPAIKFFSLYQSSGNLHIDTLMQEYHRETDGDYSVASLLSHFADRVEHHLTIIDIDGKLKALSWDIIKEYLRETLAIEDIEAQWLNYGDSQQDVVTLAERKWQIFYFDSESSAKRHLSYIKSIIPAFEADLAKATVKNNEHNGWTFRLTQNQYAVYQDTLQSLQNISSAKPASSPSIRGPADPLLEKFKTSDVLIKSIRWDNKNFLLSFLDGITPIKNQPRNKQPLRQGDHKPWTVYGTGFYKRSKKPSPYPLKPEKIKTKKEKRSQPQSTTLVNPEVQSPVFGHQAARRDKLAGCMFLADDALMNRWFKYDTGTRGRPYEHLTEESAKEYYKKKVLTNDPVLFESFEEFKKNISQQEDKLNEVLARIRWKDGKSCVAVYSDTFEARCIAQHYAESLKHRLKLKAKAEGSAWDDDIEIPIFNYLPGNPKHWTRYTSQEQAKDRKEVDAIINDKNELNAAIAKGDLEFLLLAEDPFSILELKALADDQSLVEHISKQKELSHLVSSLMERALMKNKEKAIIFMKASPELMTRLFYQAIKKDQVDRVEMFLSHVDISLDVKNSALRQAAYVGNVGCVNALLNYADIDVNHRESIGGEVRRVFTIIDSAIARSGRLHDLNNNALMAAARSGQIDCVKALLSHADINVNAMNEFGASALMMAADNGHVGCVKALLSHADIDVSAKRLYIPESALTMAENNGHSDCVKLILTHQLTNYLQMMSERESEFKPSVPLFASLFGVNGCSKTAKIQAAMKVLSFLNNTPQDTVLTKEDIAALRNGKLGDIVKYLPDPEKARIRLSGPK